MTNGEVLRSLIQNSGLKYKYIAEQLGITPYGLNRKINNLSEFKASEIKKLCDMLRVSPVERERVFFTRSVE